MYTVEDIIKLSDVKKMKDGEYVKGLVFVKEYKKKPTKTGGTFIEGVLEVCGAIPFKAWSSSSAYGKFDTEDYTGVISTVCAKVNYFGGSISLILDDIFAAKVDDCGICEDDFLAEGYDGESYFINIKKLLSKFVDEDTLGIFNNIVSDVEGRFKVEYAAKGMHDNCRGGLVAHTYKVLYICNVLMLYPNILNFEQDMNLLALGAVLHDIGKVYEYKNGSIVGNGLIVSHHTFGVEMLLKYKDLIVEKKGEEFFYRLCAIVEQHHGEFEERPRTIESYIIHNIDKLESSLQFLNQSLEGFEKGNQLVIDGFKLS